MRRTSMVLGLVLAASFAHCNGTLGPDSGNEVSTVDHPPLDSAVIEERSADASMDPVQAEEAAIDVSAEDATPGPDTGTAGDTCETAVPLAAGIALVDQATSIRGAPNAFCEPSDAPQTFYAYTLPAHMRSIVTVTPVGTWRAVLRAMVSCDAVDCLSDAVSDSLGSPVQLVIDSPGDQDLTKYISVSLEQAGAVQHFAIEVDLQPLAMESDASVDAGVDSGMDAATDSGMDAAMDSGSDGAAPMCALPVVRPLSLPNDTAMGSPSGVSAIASTRCGAAPGPEDIYSLHVTTQTGVDIAVHNTQAVLSLRRMCDEPSSEVACAIRSESNLYALGTVDLHRVLDPGDYFVIVDFNTTTPLDGSYTLALTSFPVPATTSCATAPTIGVGTTTGRSDEGGAPSDVCFPAAGPQSYYRIAVPPMSRLLVQVATEAFVGSRPLARLFDTCGASSCRDLGVVRGGDFNWTYVSADNATGAPQTVVLSVAEVAQGVSRITIVVRVNPLVPAPANATCADATVLMADPFFPQEVLAGARDRLACEQELLNGPSLYYTADIPPGSVLNASVNRAENSDGAMYVVRVLDTCDGTTCDAVLTGPSGSPDVAVHVPNGGSTTRHAIVAVGSQFADRTGNFALAANIVPMSPDASCATATVLSSGVALADQNIASGFAGATISGDPLARFFTIDVPAHSRVDVSVTSPNPPAWRRFVDLYADCALTPVIATPVNVGFGTNETRLVYENIGTSTTHLIIRVSARFEFIEGTFDITATVAPSGTNATCATATSVTEGTVIHDESTQLGTALPFTCSPNVSDAVMYYSAPVPAGREIMIVAHTTTPGIFHPSIRLFDDCNGTTCLAGSSPAAEDDAFVQWTNASTSDRSVLFAVSDPGALYDLYVHIEPPPYLLEHVPTSCDDMSTATVLLTEAFADTTSMPLPFAFPYFGAAVTNFDAFANGVIQLQPGGYTGPGVQTDGAVIPSLDAFRGNLVAPFWARLAVVPGGSSDVRVATFGTSPDRHTNFQWTNWTYLNTCVACPFPDSGERVTFQIKFFETTGAIEFHYCDLTQGQNVGWETGGGAAIGIDDGSGTRGIAIGFRQPDVVSEMNALRFIPNP